MQLTNRVHVQDMGEETALVQFETGYFYGVNEVGQRIIALIQEKQTREAIVAAIAAEYSVAADDIAADVDAFISELTREKILETR